MEVHTMKRATLIAQTFVLMLTSLPSSIAAQSLECYSDGIEVVTCVWNSSSLHMTSDTNCSLQGTLFDYFSHITVKEELVPLEDSTLYEATLNFSGEYGLTNTHPSFPVSVYCGNQTEPKATISDFTPVKNIRLSPPEKLEVYGANVSWTPRPHSEVERSDCSFQLQYRPTDASWKDSDIVDIQAESCLLPKEKLILGAQYEVRVRSKYIHSPFWSQWSPALKWTSTVGTPVHTPPPGFLGLPSDLMGTVLVVVLAVILLVLFCIHPVVRCLKNRFTPKPSRYFKTLDEWDFKAWLGPFMSPELFIKADSEVISRVEVHESVSPDALYRKDSSTSWGDKTDRNTSSFSNSIYFLSQSSKCKTGVNQLESGLPQCSNGPVEGDSALEESDMSSPLQTSSSYKHMPRRDVQSPDSGFAPDGEDQEESQEDSGSEDLPSPPVVDDTLTVRHILACPQPMMPHLARFPNPPGLVWSPEGTWAHEVAPLCITTSMLMADFDLTECSGMVEPSSGDYMPVKKVQE
ncbi:uncharacterized protein LOC143522066 [Brachyhypopomus gauderio]|uniref:uncharacterized protein LOC143522066 n=1 Tax=Brachyhypopomus gauderio TaxID=698409 RepID=UPI0040429B0E